MAIREPVAGIDAALLAVPTPEEARELDDGLRMLATVVLARQFHEVEEISRALTKWGRDYNLARRPEA